MRSVRFVLVFLGGAFVVASLVAVPAMRAAEPNLDFKLDPTPLIHLDFSSKHRFGISTTEPDPIDPAQRKRLTYEAKGLSNNVRVRIDGYDNLFGQQPGVWKRGYVPGKAKGETVRAMDAGPEKIRDGFAWRSTMAFEQSGIVVTQTLALVATPPGEVKGEGKVSSVLVHYVVENTSAQEHKVGLRFLLDTFVGATDGVPFVVPGLPGLMATMHDFGGGTEVPAYMAALESPKAAVPGSGETIAQLNLRVPKTLNIYVKDPEPEGPVRACILRWPGNSEAGWNDWIDKDPANPRGIEKPFASARPINEGQHKDSCVAVFWDERQMAAGERRVLAFTYGLGRVAAYNEKLALGLLVGGIPSLGDTFTLTAIATKPKNGASVTIVLPEGMKLEGDLKEKKLEAQKGDALETTSWRIAVPKDLKPDFHPLTVRSKDGEVKVHVYVPKDVNQLFATSWPAK
jgi:hypothetical protein